MASRLKKADEPQIIERKGVVLLPVEGERVFDVDVESGHLVPSRVPGGVVVAVVGSNRSS